MTEAVDVPPTKDPVRDLYLTTLMHIMSLSEQNEVSITLMVGGTTVTGSLIGHDAWLKAWKEGIASSGGEDAQKVLGVLGALDEEVPDDPDVPQPNFIHLRDARVFPGGTEIRLNLWRARVTDVQGWSTTTLVHSA
ncbi:hypothetical protein [Streptomyces sp. NPDC047981]|uniref:hypothetical protein n=1 Tax=Streptomyces sp. NPDC047981 TaxID=3154610 RepID=UPI00342433A4